VKDCGRFALGRLDVGYFAYYFMWIALAYAVRYPWLALGALLFFLLRRFIPDPFVLLRTAGRIGSLRAQITANPANLTARRDLAVIYLDRLRPKAALRLLEEALSRSPNDAELLYLTGVARYRSGQSEGALEALVRAVELDPRVRFGEPYRVAALALLELERWDEAEDALERYTGANSSSMEGLVRLAQLRRRSGDEQGVVELRREALATWAALPGYERRRQFGWWLRSKFV
jgi:tetratricopeptide (TPR) repeat protein